MWIWGLPEEFLAHWTTKSWIFTMPSSPEAAFDALVFQLMCWMLSHFNLIGTVVPRLSLFLDWSKIEPSQWSFCIVPPVAAQSYLHLCVSPSVLSIWKRKYKWPGMEVHHYTHCGCSCKLQPSEKIKKMGMIVCFASLLHPTFTPVYGCVCYKKIPQPLSWFCYVIGPHALINSCHYATWLPVASSSGLVRIHCGTFQDI